MLRITDRQKRELLYGPTNEEMITDIFRSHVTSYKDLPLTLYHIQWKFRDEMRPRFGVMRGREFLMKDGYSFHIDDTSFDATYAEMFACYGRILTRMQLVFRAVLAEGAALALGLKTALTLWRRIIQPEGHLCVTYPGVVNKDAPPEVRAPLERRMADPLGTLADYHALVRATGFELVHQVALHADLWDQFYADCQRHAWALVASGAVRDDDPQVKSILAEAQWFRAVGRSRVFLQAMVLRRVR
jgi:hypothetical protein